MVDHVKAVIQEEPVFNARIKGSGEIERRAHITIIMIDQICRQQDELSADIGRGEDYQCAFNIECQPPEHPKEEYRVLDAKFTILFGRHLQSFSPCADSKRGVDVISQCSSKPAPASRQRIVRPVIGRSITLVMVVHMNNVKSRRWRSHRHGQHIVENPVHRRIIKGREMAMIVIDQCRRKDRECQNKQKWRQNEVRYIAKEQDRCDLEDQDHGQQANRATVSGIT